MTHVETTTVTNMHSVPRVVALLVAGVVLCASAFYAVSIASNLDAHIHVRTHSRQLEVTQSPQAQLEAWEV